MKRTTVIWCALLCGALPGLAVAASTTRAAASAAPTEKKSEPLECANLIYAGNKSSVCFSDKFLDTVKRETNCQPEQQFKPVKLSSDDIYKYPFAIMTGEGDFVLPEKERKNLRAYLKRGGFLLASAGCSSKEWDRAFRREFQKIYPDKKLEKIKMDHPLFHTVFDVQDIKLKRGGSTLLEGLTLDGKIVLIYTAEGLNDTANAKKGCCCCGGNEIKNSREINVNIFTYSLTH